MKKAQKHKIPYILFINELYHVLCEFFHKEKKSYCLIYVNKDVFKKLSEDAKSILEPKFFLDIDSLDTLENNYNLRHNNDFIIFDGKPLNDSLDISWINSNWKEYIKTLIYEYMFDTNSFGVFTEYIKK